MGSTLTPSLTALPSLCASQPVLKHCVRTKIRVYYKGSAWKRYNQGCIEKRLTKSGGIDMLWRKALKCKHQPAVYERILPNMPTMKAHGKIVKPHNLKFREHPITTGKLPQRKYWYSLENRPGHGPMRR